MMIKWETQATNVMKTAADDQYLASVSMIGSPAAMPAIAKTWFALRYGDFSNPTLTEDKLSTTYQLFATLQTAWDSRYDTNRMLPITVPTNAIGIRGTMRKEIKRAEALVRQPLGKHDRRSETSRELANSRMNRIGRADMAPGCQLNPA